MTIHVASPQTIADIVPGQRQAIITRSVTELGERDPWAVHASCAARTITVPWNDELTVRENHAAAGLRLHRELGWDRHHHLAMGSTPDGLGYVFVQIEPTK